MLLKTPLVPGCKHYQPRVCPEQVVPRLTIAVVPSSTHWVDHVTRTPALLKALPTPRQTGRDGWIGRVHASYVEGVQFESQLSQTNYL